MFDFRQVIYMEVIWQDIHSGRVPKIFSDLTNAGWFLRIFKIRVYEVYEFRSS